MSVSSLALSRILEVALSLLVPFTIVEVVSAGNVPVIVAVFALPPPSVKVNPVGSAVPTDDHVRSLEEAAVNVIVPTPGEADPKVHNVW